MIPHRPRRQRRPRRSSTRSRLPTAAGSGTTTALRRGAVGSTAIEDVESLEENTDPRGRPRLSRLGTPICKWGRRCQPWNLDGRGEMLGVLEPRARPGVHGHLSGGDL